MNKYFIPYKPAKVGIRNDKYHYAPANPVKKKKVRILPPRYGDSAYSPARIIKE